MCLSVSVRNRLTQVFMAFVLFCKNKLILLRVSSHKVELILDDEQWALPRLVWKSTSKQVFWVNPIVDPFMDNYINYILLTQGSEVTVLGLLFGTSYLTVQHVSVSPTIMASTDCHDFLHHERSLFLFLIFNPLKN